MEEEEEEEEDEEEAEAEEEYISSRLANYALFLLTGGKVWLFPLLQTYILYYKNAI